MAGLPLSPQIAHKSVASAEPHTSPTHAVIPQFNAVFAPQPPSRATPPEREVASSNFAGRAEVSTRMRV
jgi:hypothetical protein